MTTEHTGTDKGPQIFRAEDGTVVKGDPSGYMLVVHCPKDPAFEGGGYEDGASVESMHGPLTPMRLVPADQPPTDRESEAVRLLREAFELLDFGISGHRGYELRASIDAFLSGRSAVSGGRSDLPEKEVKELEAENAELRARLEDIKAGRLSDLGVDPWGPEGRPHDAPTGCNNPDCTPTEKNDA